MDSFKTHKGEIVTGQRLKEALYNVSNYWLCNAYGIRAEDLYASHVTKKEKDDFLNEGIDTAKRIREGEENGLWCLQRLNTELTGECVPLLPK